MKKSFSAIILMLALILLNLTACSDELLGNGKIERSDTGKGDIGEYHIEMTDYALDEDEAGNIIFAVKYLFVNNSDDNACFDMVFDIDAFQDGKGLKRVFTDESVNTNIQSGGSIEVVIGHQIVDESDVTVEVTDAFYEYDNKITKTFKIAE